MRALDRLGYGPVAALGVLVMSAATLGATVWRATTLDAVQVTSAVTSPVELGSTGAATRVPMDTVLAAVDRDPFHPERRRPTRRFRLPSERRAPARVASTAPGLPSTMRLTGTLVYPGGGGAALLAQPGRPTRMVRVGEQVGTLTLDRVSREEAVFVAPNGSRVVVRVSRPGG